MIQRNPFVLVSIILIRYIWHGKMGRAYNRKGRIYCRFHPSCSHYAILALEKHGFFRGWTLAVRRVRRCVPGNTGSCIDFP
ncbi:MAG: membrane protein insertion efficiency factor YidD [Methanoregulaceae archaeon]|nr:membrane protein insertion efficiency factor YidD [Methanoregulaceae archaeon]